MSRTRTAVILAAGMGTRLGDLTSHKPKALQVVAGKTLLERSLRFTHLIGVSKTIVLGGYLIEQVRAEVNRMALPNVVVVENPNYASTQRMSSLLCAKDQIDGDLIVFDGDYLYHRAIADFVRNSEYKDVTMHGSRQESDYFMQDYVLVTDEHGNLINARKIAKPIPLMSNEIYFASLLYCPKDHLAGLMNVGISLVSSQTEGVHVEDAVLEYSRTISPVKIVDLGLPMWVEVDRPEELEAANRFAKDNLAFLA